MANGEEKVINGNGHDTRVFVPITNKDVWLKVVELEKKVDALSIKLYAFATALVVISAFISISGGVRLG